MSRIIFVTQQNDPEIREAALERGDGYVLKMNAGQKLPRIIRAALHASEVNSKSIRFAAGHTHPDNLFGRK